MRRERGEADFFFCESWVNNGWRKPTKHPVVCVVLWSVWCFAINKYLDLHTLTHNFHGSRWSELREKILFLSSLTESSLLTIVSSAFAPFTLSLQSLQGCVRGDERRLADGWAVSCELKTRMLDHATTTNNGYGKEVWKVVAKWISCSARHQSW